MKDTLQVLTTKVDSLYTVVAELDSLKVYGSVKLEPIVKNATIWESLTEPSNIVAITAVFVSVLGLIFSVLYSRHSISITKEHNILSVKPLVYCFYDISNPKLMTKMVNSGLGTCTILDFKIEYLDKKYDDFKFLNSGKTFADFKSFPLAENIIGSHIKSGEEVTLVTYPSDNSDNRTISEIFKSVKYHVKYSDLYDNVYWYPEKNELKKTSFLGLKKFFKNLDPNSSE